MPQSPLNVEEPGASAARALRGRLRDTEAHLDQYTPYVVTSDDGRVYLAMATMLDGQVDLEPYPKLTQQSRLPDGGDLDLANLDFANAAAISRIEGRLNEFGINSLADDTGQNVISRTNAAGFQGHDFQVCWVGSRKEWLVLGGHVTFPNRGTSYTELDLPRKFLQGTTGWIVIPVTLTVDEWPDNIYFHGDFDAPKITANPTQRPPIRTSSFTGEMGAGTLKETRTYSVGHYDFPLAYVEPPNSHGHIAPLIRPFLRGPLRAIEGEQPWRGAFPRVY